MDVWLRVSGAIDRANELLGKLANLLVLLSCLVSAGNAMVRYAYDYSSNGWLEAQWYMFAAMVMLGASYTLQRNEHVRVEIFYLYLSERGQVWLDLIGGVIFLIPVCVLLAVLSWPFFAQSFAVNEWSKRGRSLLAGQADIAGRYADRAARFSRSSSVAALRGYVLIVHG